MQVSPKAVVGVGVLITLASVNSLAADTDLLAKINQTGACFSALDQVLVPTDPDLGGPNISAVYEDTAAIGFPKEGQVVAVRKGNPPTFALINSNQSYAYTFPKSHNIHDDSPYGYAFRISASGERGQKTLAFNYQTPLYPPQDGSPSRVALADNTHDYDYRMAEENAVPSKRTKGTTNNFYKALVKADSPMNYSDANQMLMDAMTDSLRGLVDVVRYGKSLKAVDDHLPKTTRQQHAAPRALAALDACDSDILDPSIRTKMNAARDEIKAILNGINPGGATQTPGQPASSGAQK